MASLPRINPQQVLAFQFPEMNLTYTERDVALYALGVGAAGADPCDQLELPFARPQPSMKVLPTFAVLFPGKTVEILQKIPGLHYDPNLLLHGEQYLEIYQPLPANAIIHNRLRISGLHDKGKAAILELETLSRDEGGNVLCLNRNTIFLRGAGGFSTSGNAYSFSDRTSSAVGSGSNVTPKKGSLTGDREPDFVFEDRTLPSQALWYSLSGDTNPLHSDPAYAKKAGFSRPILHGLCTFGYATRAVVACLCGGDPNMVQSMQGRFLLHVFPGETVITEMWADKGQKRVDYKLKVKERNQIVLSGTINLRPTTSRL